MASSRILDVLGPPGAAKTTCVRSFTHTVLDGHPKAVKTVLFVFHSRSARDEQTLKLEGIGLKASTHFEARTASCTPRPLPLRWSRAPSYKLVATPPRSMRLLGRLAANWRDKREASAATTLRL